MRTSKSTARYPVIVPRKQARQWALTLIILLLAAPLAARADHSPPVEADRSKASAVQLAAGAADPVARHSINAEMAQVLTRLERLSNRIAELEQRLDHVVPPAPRVQCNHLGRCWTY